MGDELKVTQADRDAAAEWMEKDGHSWDGLYIDTVRAGIQDGGNTVQCFVRHRIATETQSQATIDELVGVIGSAPDIHETETLAAFMARFEAWRSRAQVAIAKAGGQS